MKTIAIRGATTVVENSKDQIDSQTTIMLKEILIKNDIKQEDIIYAYFTLTNDLNADFPAKYARINLGWNDVPMMCATEIPVPNSLEKCIRVLLVVNSDKNKNEVNHTYLNEATKLRPDIKG
ncbi:MAG: chorismate mutase [Candidatus Gastranaerophilales bacterium]|nr:chorismate mutase [Candidatus Gastranaerophilales bacterium]